MRKVLIVLGVITVLSLVGALTGSGMQLPGSSSSKSSTTQLSGSTGNVSNTASKSTSSAAAIATPTVAPALATPTPPPLSNLDTQHQALVLLNPSSARPGSTVSVSGSGFTPGSTVDIYLKHKADDTGTNLGFVQADKSGSFGGFNVTLPSGYVSGPFIVDVRQHDGAHEATATGTVAANSPTVTLGTMVGKPGDVIAYSLKGFAPTETVKVYFNSLSSTPIGTVVTDQSGNVQQDSLKVPFGAIGNNSFIFVGQKSQSPVTMPFQMLNLYPSMTVNTYATKADTTITFTGKGFGPNERVLLYLNSVNSSPVAVVNADGNGGFKNAAPFTLPFGVNGKATFIGIGEQSQAPSTVSIDILPYTPLAETSTYGGRPGTTITFYGSGWARQEVVHVYVGRTQGSAGTEVSCLLSDQQGNFGAAGSYTIDSSVQPGQLVFTLIGDKSKSPASAKMQVMAPDAGTTLPPMTASKPFHCPYSGGSGAQVASQPLPTPTPVPAPPPTNSGQPPSDQNTSGN